MKLIPHFTFDGQAEEALNFYASVFNGKVETMIRYKDYQAESQEEVSEKDMNRLVYSSVTIGDGYQIDICDYDPGETRSIGSCIFMDVCYTDQAELKRVYEAISADGKVIMPLGKTHWSENFACVIDKFGIGWNLMQEE